MRRNQTLIWAGRALAVVTAALSAVHVVAPDRPVGGSLLAAAVLLILLGGGGR